MQQPLIIGCIFILWPVSPPGGKWALVLFTGGPSPVFLLPLLSEAFCKPLL